MPEQSSTPFSQLKLNLVVKYVIVSEVFVNPDLYKRADPQKHLTFFLKIKTFWLQRVNEMELLA